MPVHDGSCPWHGDLPDYRRYHDEEWGRPQSRDVRLFEKLCLEGFQSGLSWLTVLRKRERFREVFAGFAPEKLADFGEEDVARLLQDPGIIRHGQKIRSVLNNARRYLELQAEAGSLAAFVWRFEPGPEARPDRYDWATLKTLGKTEASTALSKALRKRGWSFVGPTTVYAFMQACGLVNDHLETCPARAICEAERAAFKRPG